MLGFDPATVQAWSAVVVACLTLVLVVATIAYVVRTGQMAQEMRRTNDMTQRDTERRLRLQAPALEVAPNDSGLLRDGPNWVYTYVVRNIGATVAYDVRVVTDEGLTSRSQPVEPNGRTLVSLRLRVGDVDSDDAVRPPQPDVRGMVFTDPGGTRWRQVRGGVPEVYEDDDAQ
jgi:hypothetical protein